MKKMHSLMLAFAAMGMMMPESYGDSKTISRQLTPEEIEKIKRLREKKVLERKLNKGLKEWDINGIIVIALNRKNAERKAANIVKILNEIND